MIAGKDSSYGLLDQVRPDPRGPGSLYFFNNSEVAYYSGETGFVPVLTGSDLTITGQQSTTWQLLPMGNCTWPPMTGYISGKTGAYIATSTGSRA